MKIIASFFDGKIKEYRKLLRVFINSARHHMPDSNIEIVKTIIPEKNYTEDPINNHHWDTYYGFMAKTERALYCNEPVCVSDNDMMVKKSLDSVWDFNFDLAFTIRNYKCKFNTGVYFSRSNNRAHEFIERWLYNTKKVADKFDLREINKYSGIDQASLVRTLKEDKEARIAYLPCLIWNAEQTCWRHLTDKTRMIHVKSGLREIIFGIKEMNDRYYYLKDIIEEVESYDDSRQCPEFDKVTAIGV